MIKDALAVIGIILTISAYAPYIRSILVGQTKPHVFSWVIWGTVTLIVFIAQLTDNGGAGAWPIGVSGTIGVYVAFLAYSKRGDIAITRMDWLFFILAMTSIPVWILTSDPLSAVIILAFVDLLAFGPTFRKAYDFPFEEQIVFYCLIAARNAMSVLALENYSMTTMLFPMSSGLSCFVFVLMLALRRRRKTTKAI